MGIRVSTELDPRSVQKGAAVVKRSLSDVDRAMTKTERTTKGVSVNFGNLGAQLTDISVQLQGGQNLFLVLSQQLPQLIPITAGLAGAVASLSLSLIGAASSLFENEDATKKLTEAQEALDSVIVRSEDGVISFTSKIERLSQVSEQAARVQLAAGVADATEIVRQSGRLITQQIDDIETGFSRLSLVDFSKLSASLGRAATENLDAIRQFREGAFDDRTTQNFIRDLSGATAAVESFFGVSLEQSARLVQAFSQFDGSSEQAVALSQAVAQVAEETEFSNENLNKFAKALADSAADAEVAQTAIDLLKGALKDTDTVVSQNTETFQSNRNAVRDLSLQLTVLQTEYTAGARAAAILEAQQRAGVSAASAQGQQIALLTGQILDQRDAIQAAAAADKERAKIAAERAAQVDAFAEAEIRSEQKRREQLSRQVGAISFGVMSPVDQLRTEEQQKLAILQEYGQLNAEAQAESERLRTEVVKQADAERNKLIMTEQQNTLSATAGGFDALSQLSSQFIGDQDNRNKTAFALTKAFAVTSAGVNLALAISQALADPSALTLPQKISNFAAIASAGGPLISTITSSNYATGGYVQGAGSGTSDSINANISNGEFVTRASVTRRNRGALEFMNRTGELPGGNGSGGVVINYYGSGSVEQRQEGGLTIVDIDKRINERVPGLVADQVRNPNSQFNNAGRSTYNWQRR